MDIYTCAYPPNVARRSEAQATDKTSAHIRKDIAVKVGHYHDTVGIRLGVLHNLKADTVQQIFIIDDIREVFRNLTACRQKHTVGHFPSLGQIIRPLYDDGPT